MVEFHVGDIVEYISEEGESNSELKLGMLGIVKTLDGYYSGGEKCLGIDWGISLQPNSTWFHNLSGELEGPTGYWVRKSQVRFAGVDGEAFDVDLELVNDLLEV